jgi:lipopolysaccharide export system protein LptC
LAISYPADAATGAALPARSRGIDQTYRSAQRHSRCVRLLRVGMLVGIAGALLAVVIANYAPPIGGFRLPGELGKLVIKGTKITMQQPRLAGYTSDSRAYEFTANTAAQDINKPDILELQQIHAKMEMRDNSFVNMSADTGTYNVKSEMLTLHDNITLVSSTGYEGRLTEAVVDVSKGDVVSEKPVWVKLLNGFLNAQRLNVDDEGAVVRFGGGVAMTLQPGKESAKASEPSQP